MKLLLYSHSFAPNIGGIETIVLSLARGLGQLRNSNGETEFAVTLVTETAVGTFDDASLPFSVVRRPSKSHLWKLIRAAEVVHLAGPALLPLFLARICRKPVVIEHHGYQAVCPNGLLLRQPDESICPGHFVAAQYGKCRRCLRTEDSARQSWLRLLLMFPRHSLAKGASANVAISNHFVARCGLPQSLVIYHGIQATAETAKPESQKPVRFAYVGRLVREKGMVVLVEALRLLLAEGHAVELLFIGDGPERPVLESLFARQDLRGHAHVTGFLTGLALAEAVNGVSAVIMPSLWEETAGLAAMEQMMRGGLVIAADIGGLGEVVGDAGLKFTSGDAQALANAMRRVVRDPSEAESLGKKARERANRIFLRERMIAEHAKLYRKLLADRHT